MERGKDALNKDKVSRSQYVTEDEGPDDSE